MKSYDIGYHNGRNDAIIAIRSLVDGHIGVGKPRWVDGYNWMKTNILADIGEYERQCEKETEV